MNGETIKWLPEYELGIEDIDFQHHFFVNLINRLATELAVSNNINYKNGLLAELTAYARFHFISEENMMIMNDYQGYLEHKNLHLELLDHLHSRIAMVSIESSAVESIKIVEFLKDWFFYHTNTADRNFAEYCIQKENNF